MTIPKFRKWLRGVESDEKKFYCTFCEKEFLGGKWEINKHSCSSKHRKNAEKFPKFENSNEEMHLVEKPVSPNVIISHKRFRDEFLRIPGLDWLQ